MCAGRKPSKLLPGGELPVNPHILVCIRLLRHLSLYCTTRMLCVLALHVHMYCRSTRTTGHQLTGSMMSNRPPAPLPHGKPSLKTVSEQKEFTLSGSYEEPRQWAVPLYQQFPVDSPKAPTSLNSSDESKWEIPAVPRSSPPSAADYGVVSSKEKGGNASAPANRLTLSLGPANGAGSSEVTEKRRSQTLVVGKGKASASLGVSMALGKADTRSKEGSPLSNTLIHLQRTILYCMPCYVYLLILTVVLLTQFMHFASVCLS